MLIFPQLFAFSVLLGWSLAAVAAVGRIRRRPLTLGSAGISVSVLKPLAGDEPGLQDNLRSFFELDYPDFELIFGLQSADDPALPIVRRLQAEYPQVRSRLVVHDKCGLNPKVSNLRAMLVEVTHDWLVISDSNVRVGPAWLGELAATATEPGTGLAFNLVTATGAGGPGSELEALHLNTYVAAGCAIPTELLHHPAVLGKSMMFRHSLLDALGGFESVASLLAEDYVIGRMFAAAGYRVRIAKTPVWNVQPRSTIGNFVARQLRWAMLRCRLQPFAYLLEPLFGPLPLGILGALTAQSGSLVFVLAGVIAALRDAMLLAMLRPPAMVGERAAVNWAVRVGWALVIGPLRELLMLMVWVCAPFVHRVRWRGHRLRLSAGTRLYVEQPLASSSFSAGR